MTVALHQALDARLYGGKTAALARLINAGVSVPSGLAISHLEAGMAALDEDQMRGLVSHITTQLSGPLAVRSSAVDEDSAAASFAGIHTTCLNVIGPLLLARAIADVQASGYSARAKAYRARHKLSRDARVGILVQPLVHSRLSGVLFTCDPDTHEDACLIEAARGLGEAVAQGVVTPDHYRLDSNGALSAYRRGTQTTACVSRGCGGVEYVALKTHDEPLLDARTLDRLQHVANLCKAVLERDRLDIEWAIQDDKIWVLQARPITT